MKDLSIIIVSYNTIELLKKCIESVEKYTKGLKYEIIVVDNGSSDGTVALLRGLRDQKSNFYLVTNHTNKGFATANNQGLRQSKAKYILLLNSDTYFQNSFLDEMLRWMKRHQGVGIASCSLQNTDKSIQGTGGYFPTLSRVFSWMIVQDIPLVDKLIKPFHPLRHKSVLKGKRFYQKQRELDWVTGAFFLMKRKVYEQVGLFDTNFFMYTEEVDYCYRAKEKGWKVIFLPDWSITHYGGASGTSWSFVVPEFRGVKLFYKKHYPKWQYSILRLLLKIGALGRIILFGLLKGKEAAKAYANAFKEA